MPSLQPAYTRVMDTDRIAPRSYRASCLDKVPA